MHFENSTLRKFYFDTIINYLEIWNIFKAAKSMGDYNWLHFAKKEKKTNLTERIDYRKYNICHSLEWIQRNICNKKCNCFLNCLFVLVLFHVLQCINIWSWLRYNWNKSTVYGWQIICWSTLQSEQCSYLFLFKWSHLWTKYGNIYQMLRSCIR